VGNSSHCSMYCVDFQAYVFHGSFHSEVRIKCETQVFECKGFFEREGSGGLLEGEAVGNVKSGRESDGSESLGRGLIEHHDLCFFMVYAHAASLYPVLSGVYHRLKLRWGSGYEYHVIDIEEGSNPVEVVN